MRRNCVWQTTKIQFLIKHVAWLYFFSAKEKNLSLCQAVNAEKALPYLARADVEVVSRPMAPSFRLMDPAAMNGTGTGGRLQHQAPI
jgi:hypothetical protein